MIQRTWLRWTVDLIQMSVIGGVEAVLICTGVFDQDSWMAVDGLVEICLVIALSVLIREEIEERFAL